MRRPAPARMPLARPPALQVAGSAEVVRPHLHRGYPDPANRSAAEQPRKISKSPDRAGGACAPGSAPRVSRPKQGQPRGMR